jgi:hypothetical protein
MVCHSEPCFGVQIVKGDERLQKTRLGPGGWFCLVHGYMKIVSVLADGEVYDACGWCLTNSPLIVVEDAEEVTDA